VRKPYLLALALALLALFFGWRTQQALDAPAPAGDNAARTATTGWQPGAPAPDPPPPPDTAAAVAAVKDRPLFRADRRPFTEGTASARNFDAELSRLSLIGILAIGDDQKGIVVSKGGTRSERWEVKAGDELPGFQVKEVRIDGLAVTAEGREFLIPLYAGPPTAAGGGPVRTEVLRKEPPPEQPAAAPAPAPAQPRPGPIQRPVPPQRAPPAVQPAPPSGTAPVVAPRYMPGRR
jgi:hypothetical protein